MNTTPCSNNAAPAQALLGRGVVRHTRLRPRVNAFVYPTYLIAPTEIVQQRDVSYRETIALAKEAEEALLYRNMQTDIVQQIVRRLAALKSL